MTRSVASTYDDDFYAWTQEQAAALRRLPPDTVGNAVDIAHVAEEIEDLGKRDLREVASYLSRLFEHLIKMDTEPSSRDRPHRASEAQRFHDSAMAAYTRSMFHLLDLPTMWRRGNRAARRYLDENGSKASASSDCPFSLDELLDKNFDLNAALAKVAAARAAESRP